MVVLLALFPLILFFIFLALPIHINFEGSLTAFLISIYAFWLLICWIIGFIYWTNFYLDIWIITNKRLIDIEQHSLFKREVSILELNKIQDITSEVKGILATLLNYGNINVQTAGSDKNFFISDIEKPNEVREKLQGSITFPKNI
jgi:membrane protein YdbS with pleckstrin-like domain